MHVIFNLRSFDFPFPPGEGLGVLVVRLDEAFNVFGHLFLCRKALALQRFPVENSKPDFHHVQPTGACIFNVPWRL